jgi:type VII secretion integral membrane protein EccD
LLLTTSSIPAPIELPDAPVQAVIAAADHCTVSTRVTITAACLCLAVLGVAASMWGGIVSHAVGHVVATGATAIVAAFGAILLRRAQRDPIQRIAMNAVAVMFATAAGFLAVPEGPPAAGLLLAAAVGTTVSILLGRITDCSGMVLSAMATVGALTSVAAACGVGGSLPIATMGAALATLSLAALGVAAKVSIAATGLTPAIPNSDPDTGEDRATAEPQALAAQCALTGLTIGSAAATAVGVILVAWDCPPDGRPSAAVFVFVVALVLTLRARTHIDIRRRGGLLVGGVVAFATGCAIVVAAAPQRAQWVCVLVAVALATMFSNGSGLPVNPVVRRWVDVLEYAALAAVIPAACWVGGVFTFIRGLSLS